MAKPPSPISRPVKRHASPSGTAPLSRKQRRLAKAIESNKLKKSNKSKKSCGSAAESIQSDGEMAPHERSATAQGMQASEDQASQDQASENKASENKASGSGGAGDNIQSNDEMDLHERIATVKGIQASEDQASQDQASEDQASENKASENKASGSGSAGDNSQSDAVMVPDESCAARQELLNFMGLLTSDEPLKQLTIYLDGKNYHLNAIRRALTPGSIVTQMLERRIANEVQQMILKNPVDDYFRLKSLKVRQDPHWLADGLWLNRWLQDEKCVPLRPCVYDVSLHCPAVLPAECHLDDHVRLQTGRKWIETAHFVFVDDNSSRDEVKWFRAFLSEFKDPNPAFDRVRTMSFPYWSGGGFQHRDRYQHLIQDCPSLKKIEIGIHPDHISSDIDTEIYRINRNAEEDLPKNDDADMALTGNAEGAGEPKFAGLREKVVRKCAEEYNLEPTCGRNVKELVLVLGIWDGRANYDGDDKIIKYDTSWLIDIAKLMKKALMLREHHQGITLSIDWGHGHVQKISKEEARMVESPGALTGSC
ncbi:hypothetical protein FB567DRAFT_616166 [Paraphoma chrysanthemicola]|uniref:Uncharacterized protein n=1 Tax=Paraphoma chrysanthemicola TaxID=798071 RepID=A0A8K0QRM9_9PLEO|nr:hypothetical protein FB567DRAFT_616166 [Paraphoma chrysanthemicola]